MPGTLNYKDTCPGGNHQKGEDYWIRVVRTEVGGIGRGQITKGLLSHDIDFGFYSEYN